MMEREPHPESDIGAIVRGLCQRYGAEVVQATLQQIMEESIPAPADDRQFNLDNVPDVLSQILSSKEKMMLRGIEMTKAEEVPVAVAMIESFAAGTFSLYIYASGDILYREERIPGSSAGLEVRQKAIADFRSGEFLKLLTGIVSGFHEYGWAVRFQICDRDWQAVPPAL